jgi:hypothetical protein
VELVLKARIVSDCCNPAMVDIAQARLQPKSTEEVHRLQETYGNIEDLEERVFNILVNLSMVNLHSDPTNLMLESEEDD